MSISTSEKLKVEITGHTALVTIDNPAANTWDTESLPALTCVDQCSTPIVPSSRWC